MLLVRTREFVLLDLLQRPPPTQKLKRAATSEGKELTIWPSTKGFSGLDLAFGDTRF